MWESVYGHEKNKQFLLKLLNEGKRTPSLLFFGLPGVGKKTLAHEFAKAFLCQEGPVACGHCPSCRGFSAEAHPDFLVVSPKAAGKQILIEQIKEISLQASLAPRLSSHKICLIDGADYMNTTAANSLLKLLEEPPAYWLFVLIATNPERLLPTIRSRVIQLKFEALPEELVYKILEEKAVEQDKISVLARLADGSAGEAVQMAEQNILEYRDQALLILESFPTKNSLQLANRFAWPEKTESVDGLKLLEMMMFILRDGLLLQAGVESPFYNIDVLERVQRIFQTWKSSAIKNIIKLLQDNYRAITANASGKVVWEATLIKINLILKEDC